MTDWQPIAAHIAEASGEPFPLERATEIGGGCINQALRLEGGSRCYFVKLNQAHRLEMFAAEQAGLEALIESGSIRVPRPLCHGISGNRSYLVMEYIPAGRPGKGNPAQAGEQLAGLHRTRETRFGWHRDNTIGSSPQPNPWHDDWIEFWRRQRLGFQLERAVKQGYGGRLQCRGERLLERFSQLIDHQPVPSLLHGDLWSGNLGYDREGRPFLFDPAVYFGDREADIAMTELFGGFEREFYAAYNAAWPLDPGYPTRRELYNLYHILNHLNLFGGGYLTRAETIIDHLLGELG